MQVVDFTGLMQVGNKLYQPVDFIKLDQVCNLIFMVETTCIKKLHAVCNLQQVC